MFTTEGFLKDGRFNIGQFVSSKLNPFLVVFPISNFRLITKCVN